MTSLRERVSSALFFRNAEDALTAERVRNEQARADLAEARVAHADEVRRIDKEVALLNADLKRKRNTYAKVAQPMLEEFDEIAIAQHYYQEIANTVEGHTEMTGNMHQQELHQFGYMSKKLISVATNFESLRNAITSGKPFANQLNAALQDAESEDLELISLPLHSYAETGLPTPTHIRATAFDLARAIEETGKAPVQEPLRGWLDFMKFRSSFSPTAAELNQIRAKRSSAAFISHVEKNEYSAALSVARDASEHVHKENDSSAEFFELSFRNFYSCAMPTVAAEMFLTYAHASLNASRYACVEKSLAE